MNSTWRGFNIFGGAAPQDLINIIQDAKARYNANVFRVQIVETNENLVKWNITEYNDWFASILESIKGAADVAATLGVKLIIDMHSPIGGTPGRTMAIFKEDWAKREFKRHWREIALKFEGHPGILGYDLLNEPRVGRTGKLMGLMLDVARSVRARDSKPRIIFSPRYGDPTRIDSLTYYMPDIKAIKRTWITAHMYWPMNITHQGVPDADCAIRHPIGSKLYPTDKMNKDALRRKLRKLRTFQRDHRVKILIGEYSCIRWSGYPTNNNPLPYLKDLMEIFEEYNWRYTYHDFSNAGPWDLEYNNEPCPDPCNVHCSQNPINTDRSALVKSFMALNI